MTHSDFPLRQVHLDFHTSPLIPDVGADWDADDFARTLKKAHVQSINIFAKCHHGMSYYPTRIGVPHPALKIDLLGQQIEACHRVGIRCPIYLSVVWDVSAAQRHPEWRQIDVDGRPVGPGPLSLTDHGQRWPWLCVNNSYTDELIAQTEELMSLYDCDGFWYDILKYDHAGCLCVNCLADLLREGKDPANAEHRRQHNNEIARRFMSRLSGTIRAKLPDAVIFYNARWGLQFEDEPDYYSRIEIESLPTGGWGYGFYPLWTRYARNFNLPIVGMTGRFHRSWADWGGLKHPDALRFEAGGILATGGAVCIGDQMHPRGRLNSAVYDVIGQALAAVEAVEPYCQDAQPESQIGLFALDGQPDRAEFGDTGGSLEGAAKLLLELHQQFDVITEKTGDMSRYDLLIIPDYGIASPALAARLRDFLNKGGSLLVSHQALLDTTGSRFALADEMGVEYRGAAESNPDYFRLTNSALYTPVSRAGFDYSLYLGPCTRVSPHPGTEVWADVYPSYFNRTWEHYSSHDFTPPMADKADYPAITRHSNVVYLYGPLFAAYERYGNLTFRALLDRCLAQLLPQPLLTTDAPATAEVTVMRQPGRQLVHIANYYAMRRAPGHVEALETPVPLRDVTLRLRRSQPTTRVYLARSGEALPFQYAAGVVSVTIPRVDIHEIVVFSEE